MAHFKTFKVHLSFAIEYGGLNIVIKLKLDKHINDTLIVMMNLIVLYNACSQLGYSKVTFQIL